MASAILPLPAEAVAQITSASKISSLRDAILGLLRNALDAKATNVEITVDYRRGGCSVEDNGVGIPPKEFHDTGGLGKKHHTSKHENPSPVYGRQGLFLWSLASLSLLTITSHHHLHRSHNTLTLHQSSVIARLTPSLAHQRVSYQSHGTRVTVRDLFGNLPVRRKSQYLAGISNGESSKEWEALKKVIVGLLLAWGGEVEVIVRDMEHDRKMVFRHPKHCQTVKDRSDTTSSVSTKLLSLTQSLFCQASYLPVRLCRSWVSISGSNSTLAINSAISLEPAPTKQFQFISLGIEPIFAEAGNNVLFDAVNRLFSASSFGILEYDNVETDEEPQKKHPRDSPHGNQKYTGKHLKRQRKGVDRWPMFFLKIDGDLKNHHDIEREASLVEDSNLNAVLDLLQILIQRFLEEFRFMTITRKPGTGTKPDNVSQTPIPPPDYKTPTSRTPPALSKNKSSSLAGESLELDPKKSQDGQQPLIRRHSNIRIRPRFETDDLGGGVNLPRLRNNLALGPDADFGNWTKIKSARSGGYGHVTGVSYIPLKREQRTFKPEDIVLNVNGEPLHDSTTRGAHFYGECPGAEEYESTPRNGDENAQMSPGQDVSAVPDTEIRWLNPHTKTPFCFNARTGFVVPPALSTPQPVPTSFGRISMGTINNNMRRTDRSRSLTAAGAKENELRSGNWIKGVLADWKNPVFSPTEEPIRRLSIGAIEPGQILWEDGKRCSFGDIGKLGESGMPALAGRISRDALRRAKIIAQVDKKFILAKLDVEQQANQPSEIAIATRQVLVLIDQHAADERCRVESLLSELCIPAIHESDTPRSNLGLRSSISTVVLDKPLKVHVNELEYPLYQDYAAHFARWGILYDLSSMDRHSENCPETKNVISVKTVPPGVAERCRVEPQLLVKLLREEIWHQKESGSCGKNWSGSNMYCSKSADRLSFIQDSMSIGTEHRWLRELSNCPRLLLDMLNSRACRSAIMFNDELSLADCQALMARLAACAFPFQCAHGRLSMVPLIDFNHHLAGTLESSMAHHDSSPAFGIRSKTVLQNAKVDESFIERFRSWQNAEREIDLGNEEI